MVNKNGKKNSAGVGIVNHADSDASVLVSGVVREIKKNMKLVKKILDKFGEIRFSSEIKGEYLFTFVDDDGAMVDVRRDWNNIVIMLPIYVVWKIKYDETLVSEILNMEKDEHIVIIEEDSGDVKLSVRLNILTSEDIIYWIQSLGYTAFKRDGVIVLMEYCECE